MAEGQENIFDSKSISEEEFEELKKQLLIENNSYSSVYTVQLTKREIDIIETGIVGLPIATKMGIAVMLKTIGVSDQEIIEKHLPQFDKENKKDQEEYSIIIKKLKEAIKE